jgi:putative effector of murein hydrolase
MNNGFNNIPSMLSAVLWLSLTVGAYFLALKVNHVLGRRVWLHPILICSVLVFILLTITSHDIKAYTHDVGLLSWLLGPATCALAIPVYRHLRLIHQAGIKVILVILLGGMLGPLITWLSLYLVGSPQWLQLSVLTKSITTPLAIETTGLIGGNPSMAAGIVIITGLFGVLLSRPLFDLLTITNPSAKGLALGTTSHAIGTAHAISLGEQAVAFSTVALCINGITTAALLPWIISLFLPISGM